MEHLYSPWRGGYFGSKPDGCVFCEISARKEDDEKNRVLFRDETCFAVMNLYPYIPGHFMIIPNFHTDALESLPADDWRHIASLARRGVSLLKDFGAKGVNVGMNLGIAGGAGISEHIHLHLVPRFIGDTNFITTIGDTRVIGKDFDSIYRKLLSKADYFFKDGLF